MSNTVLLPETIEGEYNTAKLQCDREDAIQRDEILFGEAKDDKWRNEPSSIIKHNTSDKQELMILVGEKFLNPSDRHNHSPKFKILYDVVGRMLGLEAMLIVYSPYRDDVDIPCKVEIEGLEYHGEVPDTVVDELTEKFINIDDDDEFRQPDEFVVEDDYLKCWWD